MYAVVQPVIVPGFDRSDVAVLDDKIDPELDPPEDRHDVPRDLRPAHIVQDGDFLLRCGNIAIGKTCLVQVLKPRVVLIARFCVIRHVVFMVRRHACV